MPHVEPVASVIKVVEKYAEYERGLYSRIFCVPGHESLSFPGRGGSPQAGCPWRYARRSCDGNELRAKRWCGGVDVGFTRKDLHNLCCRETSKVIAKGDAATCIDTMANNNTNEPDFFFDYQVDKERHMKNMFYYDSRSLQDY
jgi:hypothetical protein